MLTYAFPNYIDEMKEMEDEIEVLKDLPLPPFGGADDQLPGDRTGELGDLEHDLEDRESSLLMVRDEGVACILYSHFLLDLNDWVLTLPLISYL